MYGLQPILTPNPEIFHCRLCMGELYNLIKECLTVFLVGFYEDKARFNLIIWHSFQIAIALFGYIALCRPLTTKVKIPNDLSSSISACHLYLQQDARFYRAARGNVTVVLIKLCLISAIKE